MRGGTQAIHTRSLDGASDPDLRGPEVDDAHEAPPLGGLVARRYRLSRLLGRGGHGGVWEALDSLTGTTVAVKVLGDDASTSQVRREVSALRLLRVPGVVRLFDEGVDRGSGFLVMERVEGRAFPGAPAEPSWPALAGITAGLLETLARVHAMGVVHRDIKPGNVLIDERGRSTVLDFGLALGALGDRSLKTNMAGTPAYMAPEQLDGRAVTAHADLFAVGVMLYEALAGRLPHEAPNFWALMYAKINTDPPPLRSIAPSVPEPIARVIDRMIAREPHDRPGSAAEVLRLLRGDLVVRESHDDSPRLGDDSVLDALFESVAKGRSVDLAGPRGSGRTRALRLLAERLRSDGVAVVDSLRDERVLGSLAEVGRARPTEEVAGVARRVAERMSHGVVLLIDDADLLDHWTAQVVDAVRPHAVVVRALTEADEGAATVHLRPLTEGALRSLFEGSERVFRLPSDAARSLWMRTDGWPARVSEELNAWVRAGIARRTGERFSVDRETLDRLDAGLRVAPLLPGTVAARKTLPPRPVLPERLEDLLAWLALAWPETSVGTLAAATGQPEPALEADLSRLEARGAARRLPHGRWEPTLAASDHCAWDHARRRAAHRALAIALPGGADHRLVHLVASADVEHADAQIAREIVHETMTLARRRAAKGNLGQAIAALSEGLLAARRAGPLGESEVELLTVWVEMALDEGTPRALDRVYYELGRSGTRTEAHGRLESLVEAALCCRADGARGLDLIEAMPAFGSLSLELRRQSVRLLAARRCATEREEAVVAEATAWASTLSDDAARSRAVEWLGRHRYRQQRWAEAAAAFEEAIPLTRDPTRRLSLTTGAAIALLEHLQHGDAMVHARRLQEMALAHRHSYYACRAEYLIRTSAYRGAEPLRTDWELADLAAQVGEPDLEALVCMTEAAVAWREGELEGARELSQRAHTIWAASGWIWGDALVRALGWLTGVPHGPREVAELGRWAMGCPLPRVGLQVLGMIAMVDGGAGPEACAAARRHAAGIPEAHWDVRFEILSVREALQAMA